MQGNMLRFRMMKGTVVVLLVKVLLFGHFQKAQILGVFVMIGHRPEIGIIEDRPRNPAHDVQGRKPKPFAGFLTALAPLLR